MDRDVFKEKMDYMFHSQGNDVLSPERQLEIMQESIKKLDENDEIPMSGANNIVIVIEELAELTKELTKALRGKQDVTGILEELADVAIGVDYVKEIFDITDKELEYARSVKMQALKDKIDSGTYS